MSRTGTLIRLTEPQRALAARYIPWADSIARRMTDMQPWLWDEALSAAHEALCWAAARCHTGGDDEFRLRAAVRIRGAVLDAIRLERPMGYRVDATGMPGTTRMDTTGPSVPKGEELLSWSDVIPDPIDDRPGDLFVDAEVIEHLLRDLPDPYREILTALYTHADCTQMAAASRVLGKCERTVNRIHERSIRMIRERLGIDQGTGRGAAGGRARS